VLAALGQAKRADSAAKAIAILKSALELEPDHRECRDLLAARQAEMLSAAERLLDNGEQNRAIALLDEMESLGVPASALAKLRARIEDASSPAQTRLHIPDADVLHQAPKFEHTIPAQRQDKELPRPAQPTQQAPPVSPASFVNGRTIGIGLVVLLLAGGGVWYWIRQAGRPDDLSTAITPSTTPVTPIVPPTVPAVQPTAPPIVPPTIPPTAPPTVPQKVSSVPPTVRPTISVAPTAPPTVQPTVQPTVPVTVAPTVATSVPVPRVTTTVPPRPRRSGGDREGESGLHD
jgi:hypothetical protein